jgi:hypothetical protein
MNRDKKKEKKKIQEMMTETIEYLKENIRCGNVV